MRILIIEDEKDLAMILKETFEIEGYYADTVFDGICGLDNALSGIYDLIILDVMLPEMDGFDLFKNRIANHQTKIIGFYPFAISNLNDGAHILNNDLRNTLKTIYKNAGVVIDSKKANYFCGVKENRLLE